MFLLFCRIRCSHAVHTEGLSYIGASVSYKGRCLVSAPPISPVVVAKEEPIRTPQWVGIKKLGTSCHQASRSCMAFVMWISRLRNMSNLSLICGFTVCCIKIWPLNKENDSGMTGNLPAGKNAPLGKDLHVEG